MLFVRPADDSAAGHVAAWGQAVRQMAGKFTACDLYGPDANRAMVDAEMPSGRNLLYFGHGTETALVACGADIVDLDNLKTLGGGVVIAIACYAAIGLGPLATSNHQGVAAFLGFDDELGFPLMAPIPMGLAVINGLFGLVVLGQEIQSATETMRRAFESARAEYKANGAAYGLSPSDVRMAWLYAKSNQFSLRLCGDGSARL